MSSVPGFLIVEIEDLVDSTLTRGSVLKRRGWSQGLQAPELSGSSSYLKGPGASCPHGHGYLLVLLQLCVVDLSDLGQLGSVIGVLHGVV